MANRLYNKQVSPKGYKEGGRVKKMGGGMMMKKRPMMEKGGKVGFFEDLFTVGRKKRAKLKERKDLEKANKITSKSKPKSFVGAFKKAEGQKTFEFKGKRYARVTADQVKKSGFSSLREYLNAQRDKRVTPTLAKKNGSKATA